MSFVVVVARWVAPSAEWPYAPSHRQMIRWAVDSPLLRQQERRLRPFRATWAAKLDSSGVVSWKREAYATQHDRNS